MGISTYLGPVVGNAEPRGVNAGLGAGAAGQLVEEPRRPTTNAHCWIEAIAEAEVSFLRLDLPIE
jgi:hypothetical protein